MSKFLPRIRIYFKANCFNDLSVLPLCETTKVDSEMSIILDQTAQEKKEPRHYVALQINMESGSLEEDFRKNFPMWVWRPAP